jgi:hypothetical protein
MRMKITGVLLFAALAMIWSRVYAADAPPPQYPGPHPVDLKVGELFVVAESVEIVMPVRFPICDDLKVVDVVDTPDGLAFKGIAPGKTLCSVVSGATIGGTLGPRRVFAITVNE